MKNKQEIDKAVEQTLNSLDGVQQCDANEYLYVKILNRMRDAKEEAVKFNRLMLRLSFVLALFVCVNGLSYYLLTVKPNTKQGKTVSGSSAFSNAYQLNNNSYSY